MELMRAGAPIVLESDSGSFAVTPTKVTQRNWSRIAVGSRAGAAEPFFLKQFVTPDQRWLTESYQAELSNNRLAANLSDSIEVPSVLACSAAQLALSYPYLDLWATDQLAREEMSVADTWWPRICEAVASLLRDLAPGPPLSSAPCLLLRGFDIRNLHLTDSGVVFVDVGASRPGTVGEVAARFMASTLMLNWGRPFTGFVSGPPIALAEELLGRISAWLNFDDVQRRLNKEFAHRRVDTRGRNGVERAAKRLLISTVGRRYISHCSRWIRSHDG